MNDQMIILFLSIFILILLSIIVYQRLILKKTLEEKLIQISDKLSSILSEDSAELIKVFTDQKALQELISSVNQLLVDRLKRKTDFKETESASKRMLSNISHDIKTPLTVILGYLEMLRIKNPEDEILKKIEAKAKQVMDLINEFFSLAKLEAGDMKLDMKQIRLNELCRRAILDFYDILRQQSFEVEINIPENSILVEGDERAIFRILYNLISNAVRYAQTTVNLSVSLQEHGLLLSVADDGKGFDQKSLHRASNPYFTEESGHTEHFGLGLYICKILCAHHGGSLKIDNCSNGAKVSAFFGSPSS